MSRLDELADGQVRIPMMPKGVEHKIRAGNAIRRNWVRIPMMPKGVEHAPKMPIQTINGW